jgi:hypothetical protein
VTNVIKLLGENLHFYWETILVPNITTKHFRMLFNLISLSSFPPNPSQAKQ